MMNTVMVVAGHCASGDCVADAAFDEGTDGRVGQRQLEVGVDGDGMEVGLLHVPDQTAVFAVGGEILSADAQAGEMPDLILSHATHTEVIGDVVHQDGTEVTIAQVAIHMETKLSDGIIMARFMSFTGLHHRSSGMVAIAMRRTNLCLRRKRQRKEEAEG
jgi:hypothetical protein